ncbi:hypothetical protein NAPIS_ORF01852 [Vairimorpha apis BRL 01]|uniref:Uncharacterized protein n=1 Tax=Vairimorpha apis BRL 01 TaxID=1037528 RepID=T0MBM3_9MICR|nr:hypothetical protein NAPIS_ORF01852 [Vairimorpha apis BRL 01]
MNEKIHNSILRLKKEKEMYLGEIKAFEKDLNVLGEGIDKYKKQLLINQLDETKRALEMVDRRLKDFEENDM